MDYIKNSISGYGLVFKNVFKDENLDIEALALYAYLSAYAGQDAISYPSVSLICKDLKISERRYKKYRKQLEENGYLKVERKRKEKGFSNNIYTIYHQPLSVQNVPVQNVTLQNVPKQNVTLQNVGTTNNSITNNSITNNSITNNSSSSYTNNSITNNSSSSYTNNISNTNIASINNKQTKQQQQQLNVFDFYQENGFGMLTPNTVQKLNAWINDFNDNEEIIIEALKEADENNVRKWAYVNSILKSWYSKNVKTLNDINALRNERQATNYKQDKNLNDELDLMERKKYDASLWD
ncbi:DnaD domain protein [Staphylococcus hominis]|uniref:DnaD domain protein n=1 Tax=Staphylococcus hominis TaxID=1290 RepID=UPI0021A7355F|nr:DnaD domain protein [Staphylococcus hominis]MCT1482288.1 DnaD domain protein [Staphylococcus hominis]